MQCHGGLKGPLRRIIRSLGNDGPGTTRIAHPQRHLTGWAARSPSPLEKCSPARDSGGRQRTCVSPRRPHADSQSRPDRYSSRAYVTQSSPPAQSVEPELKEEGRVGNRIVEHEESKPALHKPMTVVDAEEAALPGRCPDLDKNTRESCNHSPNDLVTKGSIEASHEHQTSVPPVRRVPLKAPVKDGEQFSRRYTANFRKVEVHKYESRLRAHEIRQERHVYVGSEDWRDIFRMLDENTIAGARLYKKRLETAVLPKGVVARFTGNAGAALKEIQEHTGCHVQIAGGVPRSKKVSDTFAGLDFMGSSSQIKRALEMLPQLLDVLPVEQKMGIHGSRKLDEFAIERKDRSGEELNSASVPLADGSLEHQDPASNDRGIEQELDRWDEEDEKWTSPSTVIRAVWTEDRLRKLRVRNVLDKPPESLSTPLEVTAYVEDLCQSVPRSIRRLRGKDHVREIKMGHVQTVMRKLISLFSTPVVARMATSHAIDRAIQFLAKHSNFAAFRELYVALEDGGYTLTTSNWNCCLAAAAKADDVHNYRYTLKVMLRHEAKPDPVTWATFHDLMCRRFPRGRRLIEDSMAEKGLLSDSKAARLLVQNCINHDMKQHMALGGDLQTFVRLYDNRFNSLYGLQKFQWLTVDAVNRMAAVLIPLGRLVDAFNLLKEFHERNGESAALEVATLNTFLTSSLRDRDLRSAVATLKHFRVGQPGAVVPDEITYRILFTIAWDRLYSNVVRVIWRYACANGHVSKSILKRMKTSLGFPLPAELPDGQHLTRGYIWRRTFAAKFAIGLNSGLNDKKDASLEGTGLTNFETRLLQMESQEDLPHDSPLLEARWKFLENTFDKDLASAGLVQPKLPFHLLMESACTKDRAWRHRGLFFTDRFSKDMFEQMLRDGQQVPMEAGDGALEIRSWEVPAILRQSPADEQFDDDSSEAEHVVRKIKFPRPARDGSDA